MNLLRSSVALRLLRDIIIFLLAVVNKLNLVGVLATSHWFFSLLICDKRLILFNIINLTISKTDVIPLVHASPNRSQDVGSRNEEELGHVENVQELGTVANIEPHPITIRFQALCLHT